MSWKRPNIGSRVNREVHARFWERAEVKFLRATRRCCSLIPGLGVKLSTTFLAGPTVLSAVGLCPPHDGVRRRWWVNVEGDPTARNPPTPSCVIAASPKLAHLR